MERYAGKYGEFFATNQQEVYGGTYNQTFEKFLSMIYTAIDADEPRVLDLMAGGGNITEIILKKKPDLPIVATDRYAESLNRIKSSGSYPNLEVVSGSFPEEFSLIPYPGSYTTAVAKKCLHEIPYEKQAEIIKHLYDWLAPGGELILWGNGVPFTSPQSRRMIINARNLSNFNDILDIPIKQSEEGLSEFINLWVFAKDWFNGNIHERENRYFSSKREVTAYLEESGFTMDYVSKDYEYYYLLNSVKHNERAKRAELNGDIPGMKKAFADENFKTFCCFTEKFLFEGGNKTYLGERLNATYVEYNGQTVAEFVFPVYLMRAGKAKS